MEGKYFTDDFSVPDKCSQLNWNGISSGTGGHSANERALEAQDLWTKKKAEKGCCTETISRVVLVA